MCKSLAHCCPSFQGEKKKESPEGYKAERSRIFFIYLFFFKDALTSNSLHTESWLHLSHAIQPLNDGPGKKKKKEKKRKKERKKSSKKEIHTRFPLARTQATAAPRRE